MSFRPCTDAEKADLKAKIKKVEERIELYHSYLASLKEQLAEGVWEYHPPPKQEG